MGDLIPQPDYLSSIYYGIISLSCIYGLATGSLYLPAAATGPFIYSMLVTVLMGVFPFLAAAWGSFADLFALALGNSKNPNQPHTGSITDGIEAMEETRQKIDTLYIASRKHGMVLLSYVGLLALFAVSFSKLDIGSQKELFSPLGIGFFAVSLVQIAFLSFPRGSGESGISKLVLWGRRAFYKGIAPALLMVVFLLVSVMLTILLMSFAVFVFPPLKSSQLMHEPQSLLVILAISYACLAAAYLKGIAAQIENHF